MQSAVGVPTFRNCVLNVPLPSNTWMRLLPSSADVHVALRVDRDAVDDVELAGRRAARPPRLDVLAARLVLGDPRVAVAVGHVDVAGRVPRDVGRPLEALAFGARARAEDRRWRRRWRRARRLPRRAAAGGAVCTTGTPVGSGVERQRRHAHRFRLAAENHLHAPVRIELDHLRRHLIDDPDVVLRIDAHLLRLQQAVRALADLADELAGPIELEQPRAAVRHGARGAERRCTDCRCACRGRCRPSSWSRRRPLRPCGCRPGTSADPRWSRTGSPEPRAARRARRAHAATKRALPRKHDRYFFMTVPLASPTDGGGCWHSAGSSARARPRSPTRTARSGCGSRSRERC